MLSASAVLPMLGRAARITSSESCRPPVSSSKSMKPVSRPPYVWSCCMRASMRASDSWSTSRIDADLRVAFGIEDAKDSLFGAGQHLAGIDACFVRFLNDVGARRGSASGAPLYRGRCGRSIRRGRRWRLPGLVRAGRRRRPPTRTGRRLEQLAEERRIDLPAAFVEGQHVGEDRAMGVVVEVLGPDDEGDFVAGFGQRSRLPRTARSASRLRGGWRSSISPTPLAFTCAAVFLPWPQVRSVC